MIVMLMMIVRIVILLIMKVGMMILVVEILMRMKVEMIVVIMEGMMIMMILINFKTNDRKKKLTVKTFKQYGLSITTECNLKTVKFFDITFDLKDND